MSPSIPWFGRLDAWFGTVVSCLAENEPLGGHRPKCHVEAYRIPLLMEMELFTGNVCG